MRDPVKGLKHLGDIEPAEQTLGIRLLDRLERLYEAVLLEQRHPWQVLAKYLPQFPLTDVHLPGIESQSLHSLVDLLRY